MAAVVPSESQAPSTTAWQFGVHSEVGKLRRVMIHRPDLELKRLTPNNHDELLFDDVLWVRRARQQHDSFADLMRDRGIDVVYLEELLTETLHAADARQWVLDRAVTPFTVGAGMSDEIRAYLEEIDPVTLADHLIGGLTVGEAVDILKGKGVRNSASNRTGDQLVTVRIVLPDTVDDKLAYFMSEWRQSHRYNPGRS